MINLQSWATAACGLAAAFLLAGCERPPVESTQTGYRGTGIVQVVNPRIAAANAALHAAPPTTPPAGAEGPKARDVYQNVKVLGDLSVAEFSRHMVAITEWVSPEQGCNYCHNPGNLADDSKYTKVVSRRMIEMTQHLNVNWKDHVANTGVTCYTCHRGQPVPANVWFNPVVETPRIFIGDDAGQNKVARQAGLSSLPYDPFTPYLEQESPIRVGGPTALPTGNRASTKQAEFTYSLMIHMSSALGVNCTFCHNTRNFATWEDAPPQRVTAYHGIRMARDLNNAYIQPLAPVFPAERLGPGGDAAKANCATCHQGANKPLFGAQMAKDYSGLSALAQALAPGSTLPPPLAEAMRSVMYFDVGSATLHGEQAKGLAQLVATMTATPTATATISGYHSASGELAANQELAKQRAFTVRDALLAAGIAEQRVVLDKPLQAEANIAGEDPVARRVEVTVK